MKLGLGSQPRALQDGLGSWNGSAADACDIWNGYLDFITLSSTSSSTVPEVSGDGINATFFSSTVFGDDFGDLTLAVTVYLTNQAETEITEADVVVNSAYAYDSYRGPEQSGVYDIHRILLHEYGHVLGLNHSGTAGGLDLMEPVISDVDHPYPDDVAGVRYLYGASFYLPPPHRIWRIEYPFVDTDILPNNNPTSFSATGLPLGISIDSQSGRLDGTPTTRGAYEAIITAHGPLVDLSEGYRFTVLGLEDLPGLLAIIPGGASSIVADPARPRIYMSGYDGISLIDSETFEASVLFPDLQGLLSISADGSKLLILGAEETQVDLDSLNILATFPIPGSNSPILEGINNQAYVGGQHEVYQFDATTGVLQQTFAETDSTLYFRQMAMSPDRQTLYIARDGDLVSYDISGVTPVQLRSRPGSYFYPTTSPDGQFLYYVEDNASGGQSAVRAQLPVLAPVATYAGSMYLGTPAVGLDGTVYQSIFPTRNDTTDPSGFYSLFDPVTLEQTYTVELGNLQGDLYPYYPLEIAFDSSGEHFFAIVAGFYGNEVWAFPTNLASYPPAVQPTKNLLNISTRAHVETGDNAMIAGFIIDGPTPKEVVVRGIGPSLALSGAMSNPKIDLYDSDGKLLMSNDDWKSDEFNILTTLIPPDSARESAIHTTLSPGAYTAIVRDRDGQTGLALVEVYDLDPKASVLANISTRGRVEPGDNVMIAGFIIGGQEPTNVLVRAIGPSLAGDGILQPLSDPVLELHDATGKLIFTNDDWRSTQQADIIATGIPPSNDKESAILATLDPGSYTAIVRGQDSATGIALVEVYNLDSAGEKAK